MHLHPSMLHARTNGYQSHLRATLPGLDFAYPSIHPIPSMPALTAVPCRCPVGTGTSAAVDWTQEAAAHLAWFRLARLALWQGKAEQEPKARRGLVNVRRAVQYSTPAQVPSFH